MAGRAHAQHRNAPPLGLQDGLKRCVNAVDLVHAVTALLECGTRKGPSANFGDHVDKFWWGGRGPAQLDAGVNMLFNGAVGARGLCRNGGRVGTQQACGGPLLPAALRCSASCPVD